MKELCIASLISLILFAVAFYQSYRDEQRWKRIASGMSLFGAREDFPPLILDGANYEPHDRRVMVVWGNRKRSGFETVGEARVKVEKERGVGKARAAGAQIFAWDGHGWHQRA